MGDRFCPELVMGIVVEQWQQTTSIQQQKWRKEGEALFQGQLAQSYAKDQSALKEIKIQKGQATPEIASGSREL